jgi:hypothetical protein
MTVADIGRSRRTSSTLAAAVIFVGIVGLGLVQAATAQSPQPMAATGTLRPATEFAGITDPRTRSVALFEEASKVITSPRCMNCHPATDRPTQTEAMRPHEPWVVRGADGSGAPGMRCTTCHQAENFDPAGVPGNPKWHLAPLSMAWQGKTPRQICEQIKDPQRNGHLDQAALIHHMAEDPLVGWGWHPGGHRTPAPGTQAEFGALIRAWLDTGGHCPS